MVKKSTKTSSATSPAGVDQIVTGLVDGALPVDLDGLPSEPYFETDEELEDGDDLSLHLPVAEDLQVQLEQFDLGYFASTNLRGPPEAPYNGRFLVAEHHEEWGRLVREHKRLCLLAPRDHGKCPMADSLILQPDGSRVKVQDWRGGEVLAYNPATHALEVDYATPSKKLPKEQCYQITTRTGRVVRVNAEHKLKTFSAWVRADALKVGQRIAVPRKLEGLGATLVPDAWLLGLLVGDGGLTGSNVCLTTTDAQVLDALRSMGCYVSEPDESGQTYRLRGLQGRMREVGLMGKDAHEKRVPKCIFSAQDGAIAEFLGGYLDSDAHVSHHAGGSVEFYSVSKDLLRDVQHLLVRLGVVAVLGAKRGRYKGKIHHSWRLTIRGQSIVKLQKVLRPRGERKAQLEALASFQRVKTEGGTVDLLPKEACKLIGHSEDWFRKRGTPRYSRKHDLTRSKALALAEAEGNEELRALANAEILWDEITEIKDLGRQHVYAISVRRLQNYVCDDVINHNTFFMDFAYPIWMAWKNPGRSGFIFSATQAQASRILADIRTEIETNPKLAHLLPEKRGKWNDHEIKLANGHTIYARGFGTRVRGAHPVWIVCDDVLNDETAYSDTVRRKQNDYFFNAVSNMLVPNGQLIVVGTPFHSSDLYAEIQERPAYHHVRYSAIRPDGSPLWPERYSLALLRWKRDMDIGPLRFSREFQCEPISDDISLFPSYLFTGASERPNLKLGLSAKFWAAMDVTIYMGVDFAISGSTQADYTVIWVMGVDPQGNRWIVDIFKAKGMPYRMQRSKIIEYGRRYNPALIFLESNQMQRIFGDELMIDTDLPIKQFHTGPEKHSLERGIPSIRTLLEARKFRIPRGDARSVQLTNEWITEMGSFLFDGGKVTSVGKHDDMAMACWVCDQAIRTGSAFTASWGAEDVFTKLEVQKIKAGEWTPSLQEEIQRQITAPTDAERDTGGDGREFGQTVQIVAGETEVDVDDIDPNELDDIFSARSPGDWRPKEAIPIPGSAGKGMGDWF